MRRKPIAIDLAALRNPVFRVLGINQILAVGGEQVLAVVVTDAKDVGIVEARQRYEAATDAMRTLAATKSEIKVLAISVSETTVSIGNLGVIRDLVLYRDLGVALVKTGTPDAPKSGAFQEISWEQLEAYPADLIKVVARPQNRSREQLVDDPL